MKLTLPFVIALLSACSTGRPIAVGELVAAAPQRAIVQGQIVHWGLATHLLCPTAHPAREPPFTDCIDLAGPERAMANSGCAVVSGNYEPYVWSGERFNIPSGHLMSKLGLLKARSVESCSGR